MMKSLLICLTVAVMSVFLSSCWDEVDMQDIAYVAAIGIDYEDGKYIMYVQMINFSEIAKTSSPSSQPQRVWVGKGVGTSVLMAYNNLSRASYATLNLEHLKTIVIHDRALNKARDVLDGLNRNRASRYTSLIYGTHGEIEELLTSDTFFDQSPLNSIFYMPEPNGDYNSYIEVLNMQTAVQSLKEPGKTTIMPTIGTTTSYWKHGEKKMNTQIIDGLFVFNNFKYLGDLTYKQVLGLRWVNPSFKKIMLEVQEGDNGTTITVTKGKAKLKSACMQGHCQFTIDADYSGHIIEMTSGMTQDEIEQLVEAKIEKEIETTYEIGVAKGMDLFDLEHHLYRYNHAFWKQHSKDKGWKPDKKQLELNVHFQMKDSGKFDLNEDT